MVFLLVFVAIFLVAGSNALIAHTVATKIEKKINAKIDEKEQKFSQAIMSVIDSPDINTPSVLAQAVDQAGQVFARSLMKESAIQVKAENSHVARVANGISDEIEAQQNPLVALLAGNKRGKNSAVIRLAELLTPMLANKGGNNGQLPMSLGNEYQGRKHKD